LNVRQRELVAASLVAVPVGPAGRGERPAGA
jgi:hypothetical protein